EKSCQGCKARDHVGSPGSVGLRTTPTRSGERAAYRDSGKTRRGSRSSHARDDWFDMQTRLDRRSGLPEPSAMRERLADEIDPWRSAQRGDAGARERLASLAHEIAVREMRLRGAPIDDREDLAQEAVRSTLAFLGAARETPKDLRAFLKF